MGRRSPTIDRAKTGLVARTIFIAGGAILVTLASAGLILMAWPARLLSDDGLLTPEFLSLLASSQVRLGWILIAVGIAAPLLLRAGNYLLNALHSFPPWIITIACSSAGAGLTLAINRFVYDGLPHVTDEISHLFQAKILMSGRWAAPAPPCPMSFYQPHIIISPSGLWHTIYPPGHPTLLAIFGKLGLLPIAGPICAAFAVGSCHCLALRFWSPRVANLSALLLAFSPQFLLLGASWMSHTSFMALHASGWAMWLWAGERVGVKRIAGLAIAGLLLAWSAIVRPQDFLLASAIAGLAILLHPASLLPLLRQLPIVLIGTIPVILYTAAWNSALYGAPWAMGYGHAPSLTPQTQPRYGFHESFGVREALGITVWSVLRLNKSLLGWPSALILLPGLALLGRGFQRRDAICLAGAVAVVGFFFFYFYYGIEYEARFYCVAVPFLIVATVRSLQGWARILPRTAVMLFATASILHALSYYWPVYLLPRYSGDYEQVSRVLEKTARQAGLRDALVIVPSEEDAQFRYSGGFLWNDPLLIRDIIYARERESDLACLRAGFPNRTIHRFIPESDWRSGRIEPVVFPH